jgi:cobalamin biosynthesis Co2+ chelatase CbiK
MKKDQRQQSEHFSWMEILITKVSLSVIVHNIKSKLMLHLFQENKSYGVKTVALILCLHIAVHHVPNNMGQIHGKNWRPKILCYCPFKWEM